MTKIVASADCGNSPKNIFLQDLTIAFSTGDVSYILSSVTEDICWKRPGQEAVQGKDAFGRALAQAAGEPAAEVVVEHVMSHGKAGAVNGLLTLVGGKRRAFCHVFEFSNAKGTSVREITSYALDYPFVWQDRRDR